MKLTKWLNENWGMLGCATDEYMEDSKDVEEIGEDFHLIKTCIKCQYYEQTGPEGGGECLSPDKDHDLGSINFDFGCIHWKER